MKKVIQTLIVFGILIVSSSFRTSEIIGTYGVSKNDSSGIELTIKSDHTFTYKDFSRQNKKINISGSWEEKNSHIILTSNDPSFTFHNKWKIVENGNFAKSRKGMTFYKLIKKKSYI